MSEDTKRILQMLADGKITVDEAERLMAALGDGAPAAGAASQAALFRKSPRFLRVVVDAENGHDGGPAKVNIRVPLQLVRAGVKLGALMPREAREHVNEALREKGIGVDINEVKPADIDALLDQLGELTVDVDERNAKVRVFCE